VTPPQKQKKHAIFLTEARVCAIVTAPDLVVCIELTPRGVAEIVQP